MPFVVRSALLYEAQAKHAIQLIREAVDQAHFLKDNGYISRVILLFTPSMAPEFEEILHNTVGLTHCMSVWGGCVPGLWVDERIVSNEPAMLVALFNEGYESPAKPATVHLSLANNEFNAPCFQTRAAEPTNTAVPATGLGLMSYGANYADLPRVDHGRITKEPFNRLSLHTGPALWLNSEGLEFLSEPLEVTSCNNQFLLEVAGKKASEALNCPAEQTQPVGLRLQVLHESGETWNPVMSIMADGALGLASPIQKGQMVRLAKRWATPTENLINQFTQEANRHHNISADLALIVGGMERTGMCHPELSEFEAVARAFSSSEIIGIVGQAAWLDQNDKNLLPPRNNRLAVCLFNSD